MATGRSAEGSAVEVLERLDRWEAGRTDADAGSGGVAGDDLGLEQRLPEALVGPPPLASQCDGLLESLQHPWRLQLAEQVGQPIIVFGAALVIGSSEMGPSRRSARARLS